MTWGGQARPNEGLAVSDAAALSFADRKAWASRQGNPLWLWPEVAPSEWRSAMVEIEAACAAVLAGKRADAFACGAAAIGLAGYTSGTGPLLGWWIEQGLLSGSGADVERRLLHQLYANGERMGNLLDVTQAVARQLTRNGVKVTLLKGAHTATAYFPTPACRPMSDVDFLVSRADAAGAEAELEALGFRRTARTPLETTWQIADSARDPATAISVEPDDPWSLDLHYSLDVAGPPGSATARLSTLPKSAWNEPGQFRGARYLGQPALLLHLATHAGSGFHNLTLLRLVEIVLVARSDRAAGKLDWDRFLEAGRATGSLAFAYPALALAGRLSPADIPQAVVEKCAAEAPTAIRRLVAAMRPATAHGIDRPSVRQHYAWTSGAGGWLRRLAADIVPEPGSFRKSAAIHAVRARGLLRSASRR
jgi:hypothetical protein